MLTRLQTFYEIQVSTSTAVLVSPEAAAGILGSSELAEGAECEGTVWIHHRLRRSDVKSEHK